MGSSPSVKGLIALVLEQLLDLHPQLCKPGRGSALLLLLLLGPASRGRGAGGRAVLRPGASQHRRRQCVWVGGKGVPRVAQCQCLQLSEEQQKPSL